MLLDSVLVSDSEERMLLVMKVIIVYILVVLNMSVVIRAMNKAARARMMTT